MDAGGGGTSYLESKDTKHFPRSKGLTLNKLGTLSLVHDVFGIRKWPIYHFTVLGPYSPYHLP